MPEHLFRYRTIDKLFGEHNELARQTIFFQSPDKLNDPVEGYRDLFWSGDRIVWANLLGNYLACLDTALTGCKLKLDDDPIDYSILNIASAGKLRRLPTYKPIAEQIRQRFFANGSVSRLVDYLSGVHRPIGRAELLFHLSCLHLSAYAAVLSVQKSRGIFGGDPTGGPADELLREWSTYDFARVSSIVAEVERSSKDEDQIERRYADLEYFDLQRLLIAELRHPSSLGNAKTRLMIFDFPAAFIREIAALVYAGWYTACFSGDSTNSSMWGNYAGNHTGACLIFKPHSEGNKQYLPLQRSGGSRGAGIAENRRIDKVKYSDKYPRIDFFRTIGRLPERDLLDFWYLDEQGKRSTCYDSISGNLETWKSQYWKGFRDIITTKTNDWSYEDEYRITLSSNLGDPIDSEERALVYNFHDLVGIIFGVNMSTDDKLRTIMIIHKKCENEGRTDFTFYQARYSNGTGKIEAVEQRGITSFTAGLLSA